MVKKTLIIMLISIFVVAIAIYFVSANCCLDYCFDTEDCPSDKYSTMDCDRFARCATGCCVDQEGFQHNKYPKEACLRNDGKFTPGNCEDMQVCSN